MKQNDTAGEKNREMKPALDKTYNTLDYEYSILMSSLHVSVSKHLMDDGFTVVWANDFYYERTGYTKEEYEEIFHSRCADYYRQDPEEYEKIVEAVTDALENNQPGYECVCRMQQKGGSYIWIKVVGTFTDEVIDGYPVIYSVFTEITDLVQTQMEQTVTYDNLPGFVAKFRIGETIEFLDANDKFIQFFGRREPGDPPYSLVDLDAEQSAAVLEKQYPLMRQGKPVKFVVQVENRQGEDAWLQINAECIDWYGQDPVYLVIYIDITDITEQRELQKKLEERSQMLYSALQMAEQANRAKSDFLSRMSHDIRTPMNAIIGMVAIAKDAVHDAARVEDCLDKVESSAHFLLTLINDILDMSKIESGKMVLKKKEFNLGEFLRDITAIFYAEAEKKQIHFSVQTDCRLKETYTGDELKLKQILINLLGNAVKFTDAGGSVALSVEVRNQSVQAAELVFTVKDSGIGMEQKFLDKIFQPFEQEGTGRGGSGLGLAIAGNYARMMNGAVDVESEVGKGSTFTARVWLDSAEERPEPVGLKDRFRDRKILVADHDQDICEYTVRQLEQFGAQAQWVVSGEEALERLDRAKAEGTPFNMMIIDWKTPQTGGLEMIRKVRGIYGREELCVALSAYNWSTFKSQAEAAGVDYFLQKPLFPSVVYDFLISMTQDKALEIKTDGKQQFDGERILLTEDNEINLEIAQTLLESRGLAVETARNGREAVELFGRRPAGYYLAVLMDIQMPVMDGLEAARQIRALEKEDAKTVPVIAMSANAFDDDVEKSLAAGMNGHISKPVDIPKLFNVLQQCWQWQEASKNPT